MRNQASLYGDTDVSGASSRLWKQINYSFGMAESRKRVNSIWTEELVEGVGFTPIPAIILERQEALGLDPVDLNIILQLAFHWRERERLPYPSKKTLAKRMGVTARTVQRRLAALEAEGFIKRLSRTLKNGGNDSNEYSLDGLIEKAKPFAVEKRDLIRKQADEHEARRSRKRPLLGRGD